MSPFATVPEAPGLSYELRFQSIYHAGRARSFPCDATGQPLWDRLSERARLSLAEVEDMVGREFAAPAVQVSAVR
jgi:hypothetical protein